MKTILVATDFSERSDRAIRRAKLLAREHNAKLQLVHVVDDDQAQRIVRAERDASTDLLEELTRSLNEFDGLNCDFRVLLGNPFVGIMQAARDLDADLVVMGPHRRQILRDILVGTTAERTIRTGDRPVLMANGVPAGSYKRALVSTDLSIYSESTVHTAQSLALLQQVSVSLIHVFSAPGYALGSRASISEVQMEEYLDDEKKRARGQVASFLEKLGVKWMAPILKPASGDIGEIICSTARELSAELIVIGTCGRSTIARTLLGSVTEGVLRIADRDVLVVPPQQKKSDS